MESISKYLNEDTIKRVLIKKKLGRGYWLNKFYYRVNENEYEANKLERFVVGRMLKKFNDWQLPMLWKECDTAKNFKVKFLWRVKVEPKIIKEKKLKQGKLL